LQPPLGISGDPMRLMFDRDLTPHPQYAAFLQVTCENDLLMLWFTSECTALLNSCPVLLWGNTGYSSRIFCWEVANLYIYIPPTILGIDVSKTILRCLISRFNVLPPYSRAGLYKKSEGFAGFDCGISEDPAKNYVSTEGGYL